MQPHILYLSYDGMTDALGQSQVLNYLKHLARRGFKISLVSCEKPERFENGKAAIQAICDEAGINWQPVDYTKKPPVLSTLYDINTIWRKVKAIHKNQKVDIIHCRGYITAMLGLKARRKLGCRFIFDMRGFWIDEKLESGEWNGNRMPYKQVVSYLRKKEKQFYRDSDVIITLTHAAKEVVQSHVGAEKITVIPTCVDLNLFAAFSAEKRMHALNELNLPADTKLMVYSGGIGGNYDDAFLLMVFDRFKNIFPGARLLVLTKDAGRRINAAAGREDILYKSLPFHKVAGFLMAADAGVVNYKHDFSVAGRSPTKLGEYWACGLPAIAPANTGDLPMLFKKYPGSGIEYNADTFSQQLGELLSTSKLTLRQYADDYFDLMKGVDKYEQVYQKLLN